MRGIPFQPHPCFSSMERGLEVGRLRNICKFIGFGTIFLWILFGPYVRRDEIVTSSNDEIGEVNNAGMRKLLSSNFSLSANESKEVCMLGMTVYS